MKAIIGSLTEQTLSYEKATDECWAGTDLGFSSPQSLY